jgi:hypothetical protein
MRKYALACLAAMSTFGAADASLAHHSAAIYENIWMGLEGTVVEYHFANPHATIVLRVRGAGGQATVWHLEGPAPAMLAREKWSRDTIKPGDLLKLSIMPLRSGEKGGFWHPRAVQTRNGVELFSSKCTVLSDRCEPR